MWMRQVCTLKIHINTKSRGIRYLSVQEKLFMEVPGTTGYGLWFLKDTTHWSPTFMEVRYSINYKNIWESIFVTDHNDSAESKYVKVTGNVSTSSVYKNVVIKRAYKEKIWTKNPRRQHVKTLNDYIYPPTVYLWRKSPRLTSGYFFIIMGKYTLQ